MDQMRAKASGKTLKYMPAFPQMLAHILHWFSNIHAYITNTCRSKPSVNVFLKFGTICLLFNVAW